MRDERPFIPVENLTFSTKTDANRQQRVVIADADSTARQGSYCTLTYAEAYALLARLNANAGKHGENEFLSFFNDRRIWIRGTLATQTITYLTALFADTSPAE